jgi:hypothetical protein
VQSPLKRIGAGSNPARRAMFTLETSYRTVGGWEAKVLTVEISDSQPVYLVAHFPYTSNEFKVHHRSDGSAVDNDSDKNLTGVIIL